MTAWRVTAPLAQAAGRVDPVRDQPRTLAPGRVLPRLELVVAGPPVYAPPCDRRAAFAAQALHAAEALPASLPAAALAAYEARRGQFVQYAGPLAPVDLLV